MINHSSLAESNAPLLDVVRVAAPSVPPRLFTAIALFAVANTALLNSVMGSRLLYGMAQDGLVPRRLGVLHPKTLTPPFAIVTVLVVASALALTGTLKFLAGTTSVLLLVVFATMHGALLRIQRRGGSTHTPFSVPRIVPMLEIVTCLVLLCFQPLASLGRAAILIALGIPLMLSARS